MIEAMSAWKKKKKCQISSRYWKVSENKNSCTVKNGVTFHLGFEIYQKDKNCCTLMNDVKIFEI